MTLGRLSASLFLLFLAVGIIPAQVPVSPGGDGPLLPFWFWDTPQEPGVALAVGYSPPYVDSEAAFEEAFHDGAWRLFADRASLVSGERGTATSPEGPMDMGSTLRQEVDSTGFEGFLKTVVRIDSASTPEMRIVLVGTGWVDVTRTLSESPDSDSLPCFGVSASGSAPPYYYLSSSWIEAELKARIELAVAASAQIRGLGLTKDEGIFQAAVFRTEVRLSDVRTVSRRYDSQTGIAIVRVTGTAAAVKR